MEIFLHNLLNLSIKPHDFLKVSIPFTNVEGNYHVHNALKSLNLVKKTPQICRWEREVINWTHIQFMDKLGLDNVVER